MSTAGKVLVVLILLASLVWMMLTAGVDQLNRNGNQGHWCKSTRKSTSSRLT